LALSLSISLFFSGILAHLESTFHQELWFQYLRGPTVIVSG
jgi:hypothetical protein